jgi:hypothetical protein
MTAFDPEDNRSFDCKTRSIGLQVTATKSERQKQETRHRAGFLLLSPVAQ